MYLKHNVTSNVKRPKFTWHRMLLVQPSGEIELGAEEQEGRPPVAVLKDPTMSDIIVQSRKRLERHIRPEGLPHIRAHEETWSVYSRKREEREPASVAIRGEGEMLS